MSAPAPAGHLAPAVALVAVSPLMREVMEAAADVAPTPTTVLILGESGTGKELVARFLHERSGRSGPWVAVNCAALPADLLESELFGHERGAFTGATERRAGRFEQAQHGTLLLDEVSELPLQLQAKLLRVLQEHECEPLGSNRVIWVDVRILAATSRDLKAMVANGSFRKDLFYRLNVLNISLPPLRERPGDLEMLCEHMLEKTGIQTGSAGRELSPEAMGLLLRHSWPGNVRELQNAIERAMMNSDKHHLEVSDFKELMPVPKGQEAMKPILPSGCTFSAALAEAGRQILETALQASNGNVGEAARRLGIGRATFYRRMSALQADSHNRDVSQI